MKNIASVALNNCTREFDREYHYFIPRELEDAVKPGTRVIVPFGRGNRSTEAYVLDIVSNSEMNELKDISSVIDSEPVLSGAMIKLAQWMRTRYICTFADAAKCMLPPGISVRNIRIVKLISHDVSLKPGNRKIMDALSESGNECEYDELKSQTGLKDFAKRIKALEQLGLIRVYEQHRPLVSDKTVRVAYICREREEIIEEIESNRIKRIQQIRVLEMLLDNEYISVSDITKFAGVSGSVLDTLKKYGHIDFKDIKVERNPYSNKEVPPTKPLKLTKQQSCVMNALKELIAEGSFREALLHGVTGSGKTEVYLQLIQYCIENGKEAIVLVPEISLTPQMVERFKGRFGEQVAVLHSRLSLGERHDQWRLVKDGKIKIVVGARSAVFAPFKNLGIIIIDEEHENTYKSEITPKYQAKEIACKRCSVDNAVLLYGSATPSVETYYRAVRGEVALLEMNERANNLMMPEVELIDMRNELVEGNRSIFSNRLFEEIGRNINDGRQTILFLNRRGHSSFVLCRSCGYVMRCIYCNISLTYHSHDDRLICHYCGYTVRSPETCPKCRSNYIRHFGTGTQRVEEEIRKQFQGSSVIRMDMDTTTRKHSHEELLGAFRKENINIMVGTQMIAKGHDFPNVTLVGVIAADSLLNLDDYSASERTFQLITQVAGRAGRGELPGRVIIQTYNTEDYSIKSACSHDYDSFYNQEIKIREKLEYPPFTRLATVILSGVNDRLVFSTAKEIKSKISGEFGEDEAAVLGPIRAPLSKIKNKYRWRIIIKSKDLEKIVGVLTHVSDEAYRSKAKGSVELNMDINPSSML